jgi:serine/threonine-protein kinase
MKRLLDMDSPGNDRSLTPETPLLRTAHVVFADIVGYSLMATDEQSRAVHQLQSFVRELPGFEEELATGNLICIPTGDGMAIVCFGEPTEPVRYARDLAVRIKRESPFPLRMGLHNGPVYCSADINANRNVAGGGINVAQRVMDCGDAGHILLSQSVADTLLQLSHWRDAVQDLGECEVKHGVRLRIFNLSTPEFGNPVLPSKIGKALASLPKTSKRNLQRRRALLVAGASLALIVAAAVAVTFWLGGRGTGSQSGQDRASIAVLSFADLSPEKNQEYFSDGIAEELINGLAKTPGLRVAARTSSFQFKGKIEDSRVIGEKLNVATLLEGSVRKQGNRARIAVELIKATDGFQLWSETFDRELNDMFAVEDEIARATARELRLKLLGNQTVPSEETTNGEAYNNYLQGRYLYRQRNKENLAKSVICFQQAIRLDPGYARAWVGLAKSRYSQADDGYIARETGYKDARESAERALQLDPNMGEAHAALSWIKMHYDWNWTDADVSIQRALALEPGNVATIGAASVMAMVIGRFDEAIARSRRAIEIDPLNSVAYRNNGLYLYYAGHQQEAMVALKKALELAPDGALIHSMLSQVYLEAQPQEALAEASQETDPELRLQGLALAYYALGRKKESDANLTELIAKFRVEDPYYIAEVYAFKKGTDQAFEWLERAYTTRDPGLIEIKGDPLLKSLEPDPRYAALLRKMHLPL